jgi:ubiquinone/menaquinone biosynthesis C-methylase UbiE
MNDNKKYDGKALADFYNYDAQHGAVCNDINATQYGIRDGAVISPGRYYFFFKKLLGLVASRIAPQAVLADIGCGMGVMAEASRGKYIKYVGMDLSWERVKQAREKVKSDTCFWVVGDAQHIPFKAGSFTQVVSLEVIEHVPDSGAYLQEINRILTRGGRYILSTPGSLFYSSRIGRLYQDQHLYQFNPRVLRRLLKKNSFRVRFVRGVGFRLQLVIPLWLGSDFLKRVYAKLKKTDLKSGPGVPISLEFDIVTHPRVGRFYSAFKSKALWNCVMRIAGLIGRFFPGFSSTMVVECRK